MKIESTALLQILTERTKINKERAEYLLTKSAELLNRRPNPDSWSALECIEHLNRYGVFYLPEIKKRLANNSQSAREVYRSGWLGQYFALSMPPKKKLNKMSTFTSMNPSDTEVDIEVLQTCINQQEEMLDILSECERVDLQKVKTSISISNLIKLRLGDTLRVIIYHNDRHMVQAYHAIGEEITIDEDYI